MVTRTERSRVEPVKCEFGGTWCLSPTRGWIFTPDQVFCLECGRKMPPNPEPMIGFGGDEVHLCDRCRSEVRMETTNPAPQGA